MTATPFVLTDDVQRQYHRLSDWLATYKLTNGFPWDKIASDVGRGAGSTSLMALAMRTLPLGKSANVLKLVEEFRERVEAQRSKLRAADSFVMTTIADSINDAICEALRRRRMAVIEGEVGIGKTAALMQHAADSPSARYVALNPSDRSPHVVFLKMLRAVPHPVGKALQLHRSYDLLVEVTRDTGTYFLLDEAQHLSNHSLNTLRCYSDEAGVPLIFAHNEQVYQSSASSAISRAKFAFAQFESRCAARLSLKASALTPADVVYVAAPHLGQALAERCVEYLLPEARDRRAGSLRHVQSIIDRVLHKRGKTSKTTITVRDVRDAIEERRAWLVSRRAHHTDREEAAGL